MAVSRPIPLSLNEFVFDSGCTKTTVISKEQFVEYTPTPTAHPIRGIGGIEIQPLGVGKIAVACRDLQGPITVEIDAINCPAIGVNLLSISQLTRNGATIQFSGSKVRLRHLNRTLTGTMEGGLHFLDTVEPRPPLSTAFQALTIENNPILQLWHERMGHLGKQNLRKLTSMATGIDLTHDLRDECVCEACALGKMKAASHNSKIRSGKHPMDLIHTDIIGPIATTGYNGHRYINPYLCDATGFSEVYTCAHKSDAFDCFRQFKKTCERPDMRIHRLRSDNGGEFISGDFQEYLTKEGIRFEPTVPGNPQQNGTAERLGQTLIAKASPMIKGAGIHAKYWPEAVRTANYLRIRSPMAKIGMTPYEAWEGVKPELSHIRTFGSRAFALNREQKKFEDRSTSYILLGFEGDSIYRLLHPSGKIIRCSTVIVQETRLDDIPAHDVRKRTAGDHVSVTAVGEIATKRQRITQTNIPEEVLVTNTPIDLSLKMIPSTDKLGELPVPHDDSAMNPHDHDSAMNQGKIPGEMLVMNPSTDPSLKMIPRTDKSRELLVPHDDSAMNQGKVPGEMLVMNPSTDPSLKMIPRTDKSRELLVPHDDSAMNHTTSRTTRYSARKAPKQRGRSPSLPPDTIRVAQSPLALLTVAQSTDPTEPSSYEEAMRSEQKEEWQQAMRQEFDSLIENKTWTLTKAPTGRRILRGKWVFKLKRGAAGEILRYKARWVARGFEQQEGVDFYETFASVVKPMSYKAIFAIAAAHDLEIEQMDVKTAFLYGDVEEEIYMQQPKGMEDARYADLICKLLKALYGLKQSPRVWYKTLTTFLFSLGFTTLVSDFSVFQRA